MYGELCLEEGQKRALVPRCRAVDSGTAISPNRKLLPLLGFSYQVLTDKTKPLNMQGHHFTVFCYPTVTTPLFTVAFVAHQTRAS